MITSRLVVVATALVLLPIAISVGLYVTTQHSIERGRAASCARADVLRDIVKRQARDQRASAEEDRAAAAYWRGLASGTSVLRGFLVSDARLREDQAVRGLRQAVYIQGQLALISC